MSSNPMLEISDLRVTISSHAGEAKVLDGVDLAIERGQTIALVGESGCGKSLTAKAVLRLLSSTIRVVGGTILFNDVDILSLSEEKLWQLRGKSIAYIPQDPMTALNPAFTVEEQVADLLTWQGKLNIGFRNYFFGRGRRKTPQIKKKIEAMFTSVKIPSPKLVMKRYPFQLSGGMAQRVLIAMALASEPQLLIADEPGTALDVVVQNSVLELLKESIDTKGLTVLFITHDLGVAKKIAQRINVMYGGRIVESARGDEIFREPLHPYTMGLLTAVPKLTGEMPKGIPGRVPDYLSPPSGCRFNPRCPKAMPVCSTRPPNFVEVKPGHSVACYLYPGA